jgi:hypothetical protein
LINTDFAGGITASYRVKDFSTFFRIFHQSSHLGDEFLLRNPINRLNLSFEGADLKLSYRFFDWLRLYAGGTYLFDRDPSALKPWVAQAGIELQSPWRFWADSTRLIAAADLQHLQEHNWSTEISVRRAFNLNDRKISCGRFNYCWNTMTVILPMGSFLTERSNTSEPAFICIFSEISLKKSRRYRRVQTRECFADSLFCMLSKDREPLSPKVSRGVLDQYVGARRLCATKHMSLFR